MGNINRMLVLLRETPGVVRASWCGVELVLHRGSALWSSRTSVQGEAMVSPAIPHLARRHNNEFQYDNARAHTARATRDFLHQNNKNLSASQTQPTTHHAVVANEDSTKQFKIIKEDVTPVVPKCFARAINPPITLKNFFKPVSKLSNEECVASMSSQNTGELEDVSTDIIVKVNETKVRRSEDKLQEKDAVGFEIEEKNLVTYPNKVQPSDLISRARTKKEGRTQKRLSCGSSTQPAKRSKQVSLFSSFAKQTSLRDDKREMKCPVCGRDFPTGTSNETINHHVDNCLIN